jgi:hypothetical protein
MYQNLLFETGPLISKMPGLEKVTTLGRVSGR